MIYQYLDAKLFFGIAIVFWLLPCSAFASGLERHPSPFPLIAKSRLERGKGQLDVGRKFYNAGQFSQAANLWAEAAQRYQHEGDRLNQALSLSYLSLAYQALNHWKKADDAIRQSLLLLKTSGNQEKSGFDAVLLAQALNTQGSLRLAQGHPGDALTLWEEAQSLYNQAGDQSGVLGSQLNQARALQQLGFYQRSRAQLQTIVTQLEPLAPSPLKASTLRSLAIAFDASGRFTESLALLEQSLEIAQQLNTIQDIHTTRLILGTVQLKLGRPADALNHFNEVEQAAVSPSTLQSARLNRLDLYIQEQQWQAAMILVADLLPSIQSQLDSSPSRLKIDHSVRLATHVLTLAEQGYSISASALTELLAKAARSAQLLDDSRAEAFVLEKWSQLYATVGQMTDAITFARKSLTIAQNLQAGDLTVISAWQLGRLQVQQDQSESAIETYQQAVEALQGLRRELVSINPNLQLSFRNSVEPLYRELITLLLPPLNQSSQLAEQENLQMVRHLMESLQLAELDEFFRESCLDSELVQIDQIDPKVTTLYSILLEDRLVTIVSAPQQPLRYFVAARSKVEIETTLKDFMRHLNPAYNNIERLRLSKQVYDWLIGPAQASDAFAETETLMFVLDGSLRSVPIAALHDGNEYLVEQYNIVLAPGLQLPESRPLSTNKYKVVVGGVSEARQGQQPLPAVKQEVTKIAQDFSSTVLLDEDFTAKALGHQIRNNPATVFHLATHGQFSSKAEQTYLLTWDQKLDVQSFTTLLKRRQVSGADAIELLILSACETAVGDDRATLGLAGISAKAGVHSILATLWQVRDFATAVFMEEFYTQLQQQGITKTKALRRAQLAFLDHPDYSDPFFWAPFTLIGAWQ